MKKTSDKKLKNARKQSGQRAGSSLVAASSTQSNRAGVRVIAKHQQVEASVRESEARFRTLFDLGPVAVYFCASSGVIIDCNRTAVELWGRQPKPGDADERFCGSFKLYRPDGTFMPHDQCPMAEVLSGKIPEARDMEVNIERPDGSRITVLVNIRPLKNERGEITGAINCFVDITARKASEEALRASEERFRVAALAMSNLIWTNTAEGRMEGEQPGWAQFTGQTPEEYQGYGWARAVHPDDAQPTIDGWNAAVAEKRPFEFEHRVRRHDGEWRLCSIRAVPVIGGNGEIREWVGVHNDITQRKQTEGTLRESEARYRTLFNSIDEGFCLIEPLFDENDTPQDYRFLEVNPAFEKQTGLTQVVGRTLKELLPGIERYWIEIYGQVALTGTPVHVENYVAQMNRWFDVNALRVGDSASRRVVCLFTDISARKFAEIALAQEKARTENILASITDAFVTLDRDWRFTYFNARAAEIFETVNVPGDVLGKNIWSIFPDLVGSILEREYHRAMDEQMRVTFELHYQLERWFEITAYPSVEGISVLFRNITERKDTERRYEFLATIPQQMAGANTEAEIVRIAVEAVGSHLKVDRCYFVERYAEENRLTVSHNWLRGSSTSLEGDYDLRDFGGLEWWRQYSGGASASDDVSGKNFRVEDVKIDPFTQEKISSYDAVGIGAYAVQPFRRDGERAVCLAITEAFPRKWTAYEMHILNDVVVRVWPLVEHARGERTMREVEERRRRALDGAELGSWNLNPETMRLVTDPRLQTIFGCGAELDYEEVMAIIHSSDLARVRAAITAATRLVDPAPYAIEYRVVHSDGAVRWVFAQGRANILLVGAERKLVSFDGTVADITERKQAAEALRASEERFRALVTASSDVVYRMNTNWSEMGQLDGRNFIADTRGPSRTWFSDNIHADDQPHVRAVIDEAIRTKSIFELEHRIRRVDGTLGWTFSRAVPLLDAQGEIVEWFGAASDVTERKEAEEALRASAERLRFMAESMPQKIFTAQPNGEIDYYNRQWLEFTGLSFEQLKDSGWIQIIHPEDLEENIRRWTHSVETGDDFQFEHRCRRKDGVYRWHLSRCRAMRDDQGNVLMWIGSNTDVDDARRTMEELVRSGRAKDDFLAVLSHELRTPLTPVLMAAATLREDARLPADVCQQLGMMERNVALEARLIDDLLDLTKISHNKLQLRAELCDTHSLIGLAIEMVREDANAKALSIERLFTARHSGLVADPARFQQVVWNLLRNAVKFTPRGGSISVRTREEKSLEDMRWLRIEVEDSGIGIDSTLLDQIFLPFDQGIHTGDHRFGGLGLGLAIARAVVNLHGGRISAHSAGSNRGSTFVVELPGAVEPQSGLIAATAPLSAIPPVIAATRPKIPIIPLRLLVVEDHHNTLQVLATLLRSDGHQVATATTLAEALAAATAQPFDLVISDLGLPDGSGAELMKKLRDTYGLRGIAMSGYGMEEDIIRSHDAGFTTHLVKPVAIGELRRVIAALPPPNA
jgi:PAS domain S-box-containing protein